MELYFQNQEGGASSVAEEGRIQVQVFARNMAFILNLKH